MDQPEGLSNRLQPRQFGDLRGWIEALDIAGELQRIGAKVDWDCELGTIARKTFGTGHGPALLFDNIEGYGPDDDVWSRAVFTGGLSNYSRVAMTLGLPQDAPVRDLVLATRHYLQQRVPPVRGQDRQGQGERRHRGRHRHLQGAGAEVAPGGRRALHQHLLGDGDHGPRHGGPQCRHLSRHAGAEGHAAGAALAGAELGGPFPEMGRPGDEDAGRPCIRLGTGDALSAPRRRCRPAFRNTT